MARLERKVDALQSIMEASAAAAQNTPRTASALEDTPLKRVKSTGGVLARSVKDEVKYMVSKNPAATLLNQIDKNKNCEAFNYFELLETNGESIAKVKFHGLYGTGTPLIAMAEQCPLSGV